MNDLTTYRRLPGYSTVGTDKTLPPGSYSSAVADFVPDTTLQDIADAWRAHKLSAAYEVSWAVVEELLDALEGTDK